MDEKMRMESVDLTAQNIETIGEIFPNCITEKMDAGGVIHKAVNFDLLRQLLGDDATRNDEAYTFTWVGKTEAILEANKPIRKTLRPSIKDSVNWNDTENLYIEGDNLDVLKLLQESYMGKIKLIFIDPPYNTGNDFLYADDFRIDQDEYDDEIGLYDEYDNRLFRNTDSNGRFHSDWCSMIYSRLLLARNLLNDEGSIFIAIDDNEQATLKAICDEVYGSSNFVACVIWEKADSPRMDSKLFSTKHDYILVYAKNINSVCMKWLQTDTVADHYNKTDENGRKYYTKPLRAMGKADGRSDRPSLYFPMIAPDGTEVFPVKTDGTDGRWRWGKEKVEKCGDLIEWVNGRNGWTPYYKIYADESNSVPAETIWYNKDVGSNRTAVAQIKDLFNSSKVFDTPKPVGLIQRILKMTTDQDDIVMDFFSGSATTAHATMLTNAEDGQNRRFIMVQLAEPCDEESDAYKAGFKNICEIGKERIRRSAKRLEEDNPKCNSDFGFRVFRLDDSNMNDVYYAAGDYTQDMLSMMETNVKDGRTDLDLLFGCLLEWGLPLSMPYKSEQIDGCTVHTYNDGDLIACFDESIPDSVIKTVAKRQPLRAVFRDGSFKDSPSKINVGEIFKMLAPDTRVKVI